MKSIFIKSVCFVLALTAVLFCAGCTDRQNDDVMLISDAVLADSRYKLGDAMGDYTITDVDGVEYKFSDLLKEKKAIVLNFWYINCGPCRMEFPFLEESYNTYSDKLEVVAINCTGESEADIKDFRSEMGLTFPVAAGDLEWESAINIMGYPTTVVIDRYGVVTFMHTGYFSSTDEFNAIFEFFTADDYTSTVVNNLSDIY